MQYTFTDHDIRMFLREAPSHSQLKRVATYVAGTVAIGVLLFGAVSFFAPQERAFSEGPAILPTSNSLPTADATPEPTPAPVIVTTPTPTPLAVTIPNNTFAAADLKISAPIIWNVGFSDKEMNKALKDGVIHINGTSTPGHQGMTTIAGHSSNYAWAKGKFNSIFAPLTKAQLGQTFEVNYSNVMYQYKVTRIYEVKPSDVTILSDNSKTGIRLITCTPVGTSLRRLIVEAEQVFPDPATAAPFNGSSFTGALPGDK